MQRNINICNIPNTDEDNSNNIMAKYIISNQLYFIASLL